MGGGAALALAMARRSAPSTWIWPAATFGTAGPALCAETAKIAGLGDRSSKIRGFPAPVCHFPEPVGGFQGRGFRGLAGARKSGSGRAVLASIARFGGRRQLAAVGGGASVGGGPRNAPAARTSPRSPKRPVLFLGWSWPVGRVVARRCQGIGCCCLGRGKLQTMPIRFVAKWRGELDRIIKIGRIHRIPSVEILESSESCDSCLQFGKLGHELDRQTSNFKRPRTVRGHFRRK